MRWTWGRREKANLTISFFSPFSPLTNLRRFPPSPCVILDSTTYSSSSSFRIQPWRSNNKVRMTTTNGYTEQEKSSSQSISKENLLRTWNLSFSALISAQYTQRLALFLPHTHNWLLLGETRNQKEMWAPNLPLMVIMV